MKKIELLAPAGSMEALKAAVESGADAVYIGGNKFNARAYADNLDIESLEKAVAYAHVRGAKVYVTVNIIILQSEFTEALEYVKKLYDINVDAVIIQDIGLAVAIRKYLPDFEVHCSTQMAIHNTDGVNLMKQLGINRVVLARELTLQEVDDIVNKTNIEAEIFVHGALCMCYSGQCYMSSLIGGRSGNRGKCAQPCRKKYRLYDNKDRNLLGAGKNSYLLSTRDLITYKNLRQISESGVYSLKLEGRMKRPEYVAVIVHHYMEALKCIAKGDTNCISEQAEYEMKIAFNREFTEGYLFNKRNQELTSTQRPDNRGIYIGKIIGQSGNMAELVIEENFLNDGDSIEIVDKQGKSVGTTISGIKLGKDTVKTAQKHDVIRIFITDRVSAGSLVNKTIDSQLFQKARDEYAFENRKKVALKAHFLGRINQAPYLEIWDNQGNYIKQESEEKIQIAEKISMTIEKISEQLNKTKDTPYFFDTLDIDIEQNSYISVKTVNNLRRLGLEQLSLERTKVKHRNHGILDIKAISKYSSKYEASAIATADIEIIAAVRNTQAGIQAAAAGANTIYLLGDYRYEENLNMIKAMYKQLGEEHALYYVLPQITKDQEINKFELMLRQLLQDYKGLGMVISNLGQLPLASRLNIKKLRANFTLNAINANAAYYLQKNGINSVCISPELNLSQIRHLRQASEIDLEAVVYGYLPAMVTEYCPSASIVDCKSCRGEGARDYGLMDDRNKLFKVMNLGNCRNIILNSDVLCAYDHLSNIIESGATKLRLDFYLEDENEVYNIVRAYTKGSSDTKTANIIKKIKENDYTKGHYLRGIE